MNSNIDHKLNDTWTIWYHSLRNKNWSKSSYINCGELKTIKDLWSYLNNVHDLKQGMFFLMRKGIFPKWEEPENVKGGAWSLSISEHKCKKIWIEFVMAICGETLIKDDMSEINGLSISPKGKYSIIKIWNRDYKKTTVVFSKEFDINWRSKKYIKHLRK